MNLNKEQIIEKIKELKEKAREKGAVLNLEPNYIYENRQHCYWYGGSIGEIKYKNYTIDIGAYGDIIATLYDLDQKRIAYVKDKGNHGSFYDEMNSYIKNDEELSQITEDDLYLSDEIINEHKEKGNKYILNIHNNNWLEFNITEDSTKSYIDVGFSENVLESDDVLDVFSQIEIYLNIIEDYINIKKKAEKALEFLKKGQTTLVWCQKINNCQIYVFSADIADDERFAKVEFYNSFNPIEALKNDPANPVSILENDTYYIQDCLSEDEFVNTVIDSIYDEAFIFEIKENCSYSEELNNFIKSNNEKDFIIFTCNRP